MSPKKVTRWVNVYESEEYGFTLGGLIPYESKEEAKEYNYTHEGYIKTISIEIELP
jgi:hypothetical protein